MLTGKKKQKKITAKELERLLKIVCNRRSVVQVSSPTLKFSANFVAFDDQYLFLGNLLDHLDDVRQLRNQELTLFFPYGDTLLKGTTRLMGLTTHHNVRVLQVFRPEYFITDEKRLAKRIRELPSFSSITFSTHDLRLFHGRILDLSLRGMAFIFQAKDEDILEQFSKGTKIQVDAQLGDALKLSFEAEIRYVNNLNKSSVAGDYQIGVRMLDLTNEAMGELNHWIFKIGTEEKPPPVKTPTIFPKPILAREKTPNSILVISPSPLDLAFWHQCLGRKYEIITSDLNIVNIRTALSTAPFLILIYLDPKDSERASFTRKLCASFSDFQTIMFFGEEKDPKRQQSLMHGIPNKGFLDTGKRKILSKFRKVDEVMTAINNPAGDQNKMEKS